MRPRKEIEASAKIAPQFLDLLILEVLLDIRDLQAKHIRVTRTQSPAE